MLSVLNKVKQASEQPLYASLVCGSGCNGSLALQDILNKPEFSDWKTVGIPLKCFEKNGADLGKISHPLVLLTPGDWQLEISNIRLSAAGEKLDQNLCQ